MKVRCIKQLNNPAIIVGREYVADRNAFGWSVKYQGGSHVMPNDVFKECFVEI